MAEPRSMTAGGLEVYRNHPSLGVSTQKRRELEETVQMGIGLIGAIFGNISNWRHRVMSGAQPFEPAEREQYKAELADWIEVTKSVLDAAKDFEAQHGYGTICGLQFLKPELDKAEETLDQWNDPKLTSAIGLQIDHLSPEEANQMLAAFQKREQKPKFTAKRLVG